MKLCDEFKACTIELCTQLHEIDRTIKSYQNSNNFTPVFFLVVAIYICVCVYSILGQLKLLGTTMAIPYVGFKKTTGTETWTPFGAASPASGDSAEKA